MSVTRSATHRDRFLAWVDEVEKINATVTAAKRSAQKSIRAVLRKVKREQEKLDARWQVLDGQRYVLLDDPELAEKLATGKFRSEARELWRVEDEEEALRDVANTLKTLLEDLDWVRCPTRSDVHEQVAEYLAVKDENSKSLIECAHEWQKDACASLSEDENADEYTCTLCSACCSNPEKVS